MSLRWDRAAPPVVALPGRNTAARRAADYLCRPLFRAVLRCGNPPAPARRPV